MKDEELHILSKCGQANQYDDVWIKAQYALLVYHILVKRAVKLIYHLTFNVEM